MPTLASVSADATPGDAASLVAAAEKAAFRGRPGDVLPLVEKVLADSGADPAQQRIARWLRGVALGALGRYAEALSGLGPLVAAAASTPQEKLVAGFACATVASLHRQVGSHSDAKILDERGLALVEPLGPAGAEARLDCLIGLAADAVGSDDVDTARARVEEAATVLGEAGAAAGWRPRCRLDWVRAEVALLAGDAEAAIVAAGAAYDTAVHAGAPRHAAKSLLFLGVAQATAGREEASATLLRAADAADELGTIPLAWPARAMLGALLGPGPAGDAALAAARADVQDIAEGLAPGVRERWLARPDLAALLAG